MSQFPELNGILNNFVLACQALGGVLVVAMIGLIGLIALTSFGSEHRMALAKTAAIGMLVGFAILMFAPTFATILQRIFAPVAPH